MPDRTALVTGAHGFIGRHVARALASRGHTVLGVGHGSWTRSEWRAWGLAEWHAADVTLDSLLTYAADPELIIHCAGSASVAFSMVHPAEDFRRTVQSTLAALEFARSRAPRAPFVLPSTGSIYGSVEGAVLETTPTRPQSPYASHKLMAEQLCAEYGRFFGQRTAVVRLFSVHGPGLRKQLFWDACNKLSRGDAVFAGSGAEVRDWLYVEDAGALLVRAAEHADPGCPVVNGGSGTGATVREVVEALAAALGAATAPSFSGDARPGDPGRFVADTARARAWGWSPEVSWREGVRAYCEWFLKGAP